MSLVPELFKTLRTDEPMLDGLADLSRTGKTRIIDPAELFLCPGARETPFIDSWGIGGPAMTPLAPWPLVYPNTIRPARAAAATGDEHFRGHSVSMPRRSGWIVTPPDRRGIPTHLGRWPIDPNRRRHEAHRASRNSEGDDLTRVEIYA